MMLSRDAEKQGEDFAQLQATVSFLSTCKVGWANLRCLVG